MCSGFVNLLKQEQNLEKLVFLYFQVIIFSFYGKITKLTIVMQIHWKKRKVLVNLRLILQRSKARIRILRKKSGSDKRGPDPDPETLTCSKCC